MWSSIPTAGHSYYPLAIYTYGRIEIQFQHMTAAPFSDRAIRVEFLRRLNEVPGIAIPDDALARRPRIPLSVLAANPEAASLFLDVMGWFCDQVELAEEAS